MNEHIADMVNNPDISEVVIRGQNAAGRTFRPSDWADRRRAWFRKSATTTA